MIISPAGEIAYLQLRRRLANGRPLKYVLSISLI